MPKKAQIIKKAVVCIVLAALALTSFFVVSKPAQDPQTYAHSIESLEQKERTVIGLAAGTTAASVGVSMIPGDATDPIAQQLTKLSSYLLVVAMIIVCEKFMLTAAGLVTFSGLIPLACILGILYQFIPVKTLKQFAIKFALFGLLLCTVIPISVQLSDSLQDTQKYTQTIESATDTVLDLEGDKSSTDPASSADKGSLGSFFSSLGSHLTATVETITDYMTSLLTNVVDAVAMLIFINCVIPVLVFLLLLWLLKFFFNLPINASVKSAKHSLDGTTGNLFKKASVKLPGANSAD